MNKQWMVYIVETECGALYTGITTELERRFKEHQEVSSGGRLGAKFFRGRVAKSVVFSEPCCSRSNASKREYEIKSMSRSKKLELIAAHASRMQ